MDFDFSDDQQQLRDACAKWVEKGYRFERRRAIEAAGGLDRAAYGELAALGLSGLYIPEELGGMGMGQVEGMVTMQELGRGMVLEPLAQALIADTVLAGYAGEALNADWCAKVAAGEALVVLTHTERAARYRSNTCQTTAAEQGNAWTLSGQKSVVPVGDQADAFLVPAMANGKLALLLVERLASGVSAAGNGTQDRQAPPIWYQACRRELCGRCVIRKAI